ncbi:hypothetical protein D3C72_2143290 [compost metagenome]
MSPSQARGVVRNPEFVMSHQFIGAIGACVTLANLQCEERCAEVLDRVESL